MIPTSAPGERLLKWLNRLREKGLRYWVSAVIVLIVSTAGAGYVYDYLHLTPARAWLFEQLLALSPRPLEPRFVKLVLVEDEEYWKGYPEGRRPIKRDYLAQLVDKLASANAQVIALDFDTRLPDPTSMEIPKDYQGETDELIRAILRAANAGKKVVLAKTIWWQEDTGYQPDPDIYQPYGICTGIDKEGRWENPGTPRFPASPQSRENISCGYIALPYDVLVVPGQLRLASGSYLDSFALAVARAKLPEIVSEIVSRFGANLSYANHISEAQLEKYHVEYSARELFSGTSWKEEVASRAVIVGARWSTLAYRRGGSVDMHPTPVGSVVGAVIHGNFVEALLDQRVVPGTPDWLPHASEAAFGALAAVVFASFSSFWAKVAGVAALSLVLVLAQWSALQGLGLFFDAFIPLFGLWLHSVYERLHSR